MKKRITAVLLASVLGCSFPLAGCGGKSKNGGNGGTGGGNGETAQYTVSYSLGEYTGSGSAPASQTADAGASVTLPDAGVVWESHLFTGWKSGGSLYPAGESYTVNADVTFTAQWEAGDGSAEKPLVWENFAGVHEIDLPAADDSGNSKIFFQYTATESAVYTLDYTLGGAAFNDLNLIIAPKNDLLHAVATWSLKRDSYAFPLTQGVTYRIRLGDYSAEAKGGKLSLTATKTPLTMIGAYEGTWVDDNDSPAYTLLIEGTDVTVNGSKAENLTLAPRNGGYEFDWNGKHCTISVGKTQTGGYENSMLFTFGEGEEDFAVLYAPGQVPGIVYGTEEHPLSISQEAFAKAWEVEDELFGNGIYYWTFTASESKTYTITTEIDYLTFVLTDGSGEELVNWLSTEDVKEAVFRVIAGETYTFYVTDADSDGFTFRKVSFTVAEGGTLETAAIPKEVRGIAWKSKDNSLNSVILGEETVEVTTVNSLFTNTYKGKVTKVEETAGGYLITFTASGKSYTLEFTRAEKTLVFTVGSNRFTFIEDSGESWTGTLPDIWTGTWTSEKVGTILIEGNSITISLTDAGVSGVKAEIVGYEAEKHCITFRAENGVTGVIENSFSWDIADGVLQNIMITYGGKTYRNFTKN